MKDLNRPKRRTAAARRQEKAWASRFLAEGDEEAFANLYRRHNARLYALLLRLLAWDSTLAQDALQETWLRAVRSLSRFRWESSFFHWLRGIALNHCRELWRASRKRHHSIGDLDQQVGKVYSGQSGLAIDLERAIAKLPEGYRTVMILHDIEGLTHLQIARHLDIAPGTSKSQLARARRQVRKRLAGKPSPDPSRGEEQ